MSDLVTAADIERYPEFSLDLQDTPIGRLFSLGWNIEARLGKVDQYGAKAADMAISAARLIDEAKKLCDSEGFAAFKRFHCPSLAKSRTYELLAIESGTKTVEEIRAATRERVAKHRAEKKAHVTEQHSVTSLPSTVRSRSRFALGFRDIFANRLPELQSYLSGALFANLPPRNAWLVELRQYRQNLGRRSIHR
jgi:hypothetical protein